VLATLYACTPPHPGERSAWGTDRPSTTAARSKRICHRLTESMPTHTGARYKQPSNNGPPSARPRCTSGNASDSLSLVSRSDSISVGRASDWTDLSGPHFPVRRSLLRTSWSEGRVRRLAATTFTAAKRARRRTSPALGPVGASRGAGGGPPPRRLPDSSRL